MKEAIAAFFENQPYASWPYIVGVENGDATLYIGGKLYGVTYGKIKYMPRSSLQTPYGLRASITMGTGA